MENNSKHILIFSTAFRPFIGGSELAIEEIAKRMPDFNFDIITPRYTSKLSRQESLGNVRIYRVGFGMLVDKFLFPFSGFLIARRLMLSHHYKIIHTYQASYAAGAAWLLKLFYPATLFVLTLQEGKNLKGQGFLVNFFRKLIIKKANVITAISNYLKDYAKKFNKKAKIIIIPNGVDIENFSKEYSYGELSELSDKLGIKPGESVIISVSRLVTKNGIDVLIRALEVLKYKLENRNYRLLVLGDGEQKDELVALSLNLGVDDSIIWAGSIGHADLPKYLKISNIFVRPSRSEGLGNAFLEAMAAGVPIIGTKVGGIPDFLKDKETGLFAEVDNPEDWALKINQLLTEKDLAAKIIKNARAEIVAKYDWNLIAKKFAELYGIN